MNDELNPYPGNLKRLVVMGDQAELIQHMLNDMQDFIDKVDRGEARSKRSYAAFKRCIEMCAEQGFKPTEQ